MNQFVTLNRDPAGERFEYLLCQAFQHISGDLSQGRPQYFMKSFRMTCSEISTVGRRPNTAICGHLLLSACPLTRSICRLATKTMDALSCGRHHRGSGLA